MKRQPERAEVDAFFGDRRLARGRNCRQAHHVYGAVADAKAIELAGGRAFTVLTVTNKAALQVNHTRCKADFGHRPEVADPSAHAVPGDPEYGGGDVVLIPGMRVRLTRNVDKDRGFVNGAVADVEHVLKMTYA